MLEKYEHQQSGPEVKFFHITKQRVCFFVKIQDWIIKSENRFCISLLNRLIRDHWDHSASKESKNRCPEWIHQFLNPFFDLRIQSWIFLKTKTHPNIDLPY